LNLLKRVLTAVVLIPIVLLLVLRAPVPAVAAVAALVALLAVQELLKLAEAYGIGGKADEGLRVLDEALAMMREHRQRWLEAETYRLRGELLLVDPGRGPDASSEADNCFRRALDIASQQEAKSLELRAATSLSRLWQKRGKRDDAHRLLAETYGWFTEGFETPDLQDARVLLDELSQR